MLRKNRTIKVLGFLLALTLLLQMLTGCGFASIVRDITSYVQEPETTQGSGDNPFSDPFDFFESFFGNLPEEWFETYEYETTIPPAPDETTGIETNAETEAETAALPEPDPGYDTTKYRIGHPELTHSYTDAEKDALRFSVGEVEKMVTGGGFTAEEIIRAYDDAEELMYEMQMQYYLAYVESFLYMNDDGASERYLAISEFYNTILKDFVALYRLIYDSSYGEAFYADWTEEEVAEALRSADTFDEEAAELRTKIDQLQEEQRNLSDAVYGEESVRIYRELIEAETLLARKMEFDGYMEYAYAEIYERDYTPSDVASIVSSVKATLPDVLTAAITKMNTVHLSAYEIMTLQTLLDGSFEDPSNAGLLDRYYQTLGGDIYETYLDFKKDGYYYIAYDAEESEAGAFTFYLDAIETPAIYFGPGYNDVFTFVHEFGHYYAYVKDAACEEYVPLSYDLAETQSQGDEWLFLAFLSGTLTGDAAAYLEGRFMANELLSTLLCLSVNEFEAMCYADSGKAAIDGDFDALFRDACNAVYSYTSLYNILGYPPEQYWRRVVIEHPGYYVSYAASKIPAIELYLYAMEDFTKGAEIYESLHTVNGDFVEVLKGAGLSSPFDEKVYQKIGTMLGAGK